MVPRRGRLIGVAERRMAFAQSHPELDPAMLDDSFERSARIDVALDKYGRFAPSTPLDDSQLTCQPVLAQLGAITRDELSAIQSDELLRSVRLVLMHLYEADALDEARPDGRALTYTEARTLHHACSIAEQLLHAAGISLATAAQAESIASEVAGSLPWPRSN